jgi:hypothetical protein
MEGGIEEEAEAGNKTNKAPQRAKQKQKQKERKVALVPQSAHINTIHTHTQKLLRKSLEEGVKGSR